MKRRFKIKYPGLIYKFVKVNRNCDSQGRLQFEWSEIKAIAKAFGLRSKKKRHIIKRFRLVMNEAIRDLIESLNS